MFLLHNQIMPYAWGSHTALTQLFNIDNPTQQPQAEMWMGAHPLGSSRIMLNGQLQSLQDCITAAPLTFLGQYVTQRFGQLPFLFKVLCAEQALSIQVHPALDDAKHGFMLENQQGIPLDSSARNYKDPNHKPELLYALTSFSAMNGFRVLEEIVAHFSVLAKSLQIIEPFIHHADWAHCSQLFATLLQLPHEDQQKAIQVLLKHAHQHSEQAPWNIVLSLSETYPNDVGLFAPLFLNVITLSPGQAMFLDARTPHAYLHGSGLEVMANSDNVLRAGLTSKHIDVDALLSNIDFKPIKFEQLLLSPQQHEQYLQFAVPVDDFTFAVYAPAISHALQFTMPAIIFALKETVTLCQGDQILVLKAGQSAFIQPNSAISVTTSQQFIVVSVNHQAVKA